MQNKIKEICLTKYNIIVDNVTLLQDGSDNSVYLCCSEKEKYILRISKKQKNDNDFLFETDLIEHLYNEGLPVPKPIYNNENSFLTKDNSQKMVMFSFCKGEKVFADKDNIPGKLKARNAGIILAKFHNATENYNSIYKPSRTMISELNRVIEAKEYFVQKYEGGNTFVSQVSDILSELKKHELQNCIIHNDFRIHNLLFEKDEISAVLDFDWSCYGSSLKDVAHSLVEWSHPDGAPQHSPEIMKEFLRGYESIRKIYDKEELKYWMCFSCLSDAATYFMDRIDPISEKKSLRSYMYKKFLYFSSYNIAELSEK